MRSLLLLGFAALTFACSIRSNEAETTDDAIVGGVDAKSPTLDAVGYVEMLKADGQGAGGCSGTLITPDLVLTAKHCVLSDLTNPHSATWLDLGGKIQFRFGANAHESKRIATTSDVHMCALDAGGVPGLGCDVALLRLSQPVTDVTPIPVATTSIAPELIGQTFTALGFGTQDAASTIFGTRKLASLKLQATTGPGLHSTFPTYEEFAAFLDNAEGAGFAASNGDYFRKRYDMPLLEGYEAQLGGADGNAQICHGDSGGPLLEVVDGKLAVFGVASTVVVGVKQVCQNAGAVFATFGADARALFAAATPPASTEP